MIDKKKKQKECDVHETIFKVSSQRAWIYSSKQKDQNASFKAKEIHPN